jgi:hypothetical protein
LDNAKEKGFTDFGPFYEVANSILGLDVSGWKPSDVIHNIEEKRDANKQFKAKLKKIVRDMSLAAKDKVLWGTAQFLNGGRRFAMRAAAFQQSRVAELLTSMRRARLTSP